jgi:CRP/FNR family transcriptional regulator, dissimilatory nitrate respiration regulator
MNDRPRAAAAALDWLPPEVRRRCTIHDLAPGEILFRRGDPATAIFVIERGQLRLLRQTEGGRTVILHTARKGELFAEAALSATAYQCEAVAVTAARVRAYPTKELRIALRADPKLAERLIAALAHQVQMLRAHLEERNIRSARERILHHLALEAGPGGKTVRLSGSLMDLAAEIGLTHEALYRTLAALEKEGVIRRWPGAILLERRGL